MGSRRIWAFWFISREDTGELAQLSLRSEEREKADRRSTLRPHCSLGREKVYRQKNRAEPVGHLIGHSWMVVCCANESVCLVFFSSCPAKIQTWVKNSEQLILLQLIFVVWCNCCCCDAVVVGLIVGKQRLFQSKEWQEVFSPMTPLYWLRRALRWVLSHCCCNSSCCCDRYCCCCSKFQFFSETGKLLCLSAHNATYYGVHQVSQDKITPNMISSTMDGTHSK